MDGYFVNPENLVARSGELEAVAGEVRGAAASMGAWGGNLGPGDLNAAVQEVCDDWRDGLDKMCDKIETVSHNAKRAASNYSCIEDQAADAMREFAEKRTAEQQLDVLRGAAALQLAQRYGPEEKLAERVEQQETQGRHNEARLKNMRD
ncbi:excreted virulence factor EspC (type VII ESX diderm) [Herbihabitans rhizosphaerae]|uniref:Excreted virulence factor EspC (Type VII ESX diderm) n=1 Tax=Herbihabitans rhizosphaerae TaxID=1872711 RepID=A0A4Q7KSD2_9PSEU|nr:type VII secretion target [Herbihabitans rhizosphaerae]RZS39020.1 excreted virulence factor EspC (type VII ESX diderm) [Herbihabitans rhizosphaerae]